MSESFLDKQLSRWIVAPIGLVVFVCAYLILFKTSLFSENARDAAAPSSEEIPACSVYNVAISGLDGHWDYDYLTVNGTLTNGCTVPIRNVRLRFILLKPDGTEDYSEDFYAAPLSARIGPKSSYEFEFVTKLGMGLGRAPYRVDAVEVIN
jgi:hypothetical protein